jgi:hypothetical protein
MSPAQKKGQSVSGYALTKIAAGTGKSAYDSLSDGPAEFIEETWWLN